MSQPSITETLIWGLPIDWSRGLLERFEWLTRVMQGQTGMEQRQAMRAGPRRSFEFTMYCSAAQRRLVDAYMSNNPSEAAAGGNSWFFYVPLWHQTHILRDVLPISNFAVVDVPNLTAYDFRVGEYAMVLDANGGVSERCLVSALDASANQLSLNTSSSLPIGSLVMPLKLSQIEGKPKFTKRSPTLYETTMRFLVREHNTRTVLYTDTVDGPVAGAEGVYLGYQVWGREPDATQDMTIEFERLYAVLDNNKALPTATELSERGFTTEQYSFLLNGAEDYGDYLNMLYALEGRLKPVWVPTFMEDVVLVKDVFESAILRAEYAAVDDYLPTYERGHLRIQMNDGTVQYRQVASVDETPTEAAFNLTSTITLAARDVAKISFMTLMRLDTDGVEIKHNTDILGTATSTMTFKTTYPWLSGTGVSAPPDIQVEPIPVVVETPEPLEVVYPMTGSTLMGMDPNQYWVLSGGMAYDEVHDEWWAVTRWNWMDVDFPTTNVYMVIDGTTAMVKEYIPRTTEGQALNSGDSGLWPSAMVYDASTDQWFMFGCGVSSPFIQRYVYRYDRATRALEATATPDGTSVGQLVPQYDPYTGDIWVIRQYAATVSPLTLNSIGRLDKNTLAWDRSFNPIFAGFNPKTVAQIAPRQMCFTEGGRCFIILEQTVHTAPTYAAGANVYEFDKVAGTASVIATMPTRYQGEFFTQLLYVPEKNLVYCFTGHVSLSKSQPEHVYKLNLFDDSFSWVFDLPYDGADTQDTFFMTDKGTLPFFKYDPYRDLIWYFPHYIPDGTETPMGSEMDEHPENYYLQGLDADTGAVSQSYALDSNLLPAYEPTEVAYYWYYAGESVGSLTITEDWVGLKAHLFVGPEATDAENFQYQDQGVFLKISITPPVQICLEAPPPTPTPTPAP